MSVEQRSQERLDSLEFSSAVLIVGLVGSVDDEDGDGDWKGSRQRDRLTDGCARPH